MKGIDTFEAQTEYPYFPIRCIMQKAMLRGENDGVNGESGLRLQVDHPNPPLHVGNPFPYIIRGKRKKAFFVTFLCVKYRPEFLTRGRRYVRKNENRSYPIGFDSNIMERSRHGANSDTDG